MKRWIAALAFCLAVTNVGLAQNGTLQIDVTTDKQGHDAPLCVPLSIPAAWVKFDEVDVDIINGRDVIKTTGQFTAPGITTESIKPSEGMVRRDLHAVLPKMPAGKMWTLMVHFKNTTRNGLRFAWTEKKDEFQELALTSPGGTTPYLRYMNRPYDTSSKDMRDKSYKVFHHLYDPTGKRLVTNGGFADDKVADSKKLLYPHHRGIMYGFNKCSYGPDLKKKADTWHCTGDAHVAHEKTLLTETGALLGRHRMLLAWHGEKNEVFAQEERELTVYRVNGGTLVEFASRLKTTGGKLRVDGDPQHAGFQFRAHNDVAIDVQIHKDMAKKAKDKKLPPTPPAPTYYLHPDGKGELGKERNWPADKKMADLPWYTMSFVLDKDRYSVCYLNHPRNPSETRFSERDYGRFGGYFEAEVTEERPLIVTYRLWMQSGEMTAEQAMALRAAFASPPSAVVRAK